MDPELEDVVSVDDLRDFMSGVGLEGYQREAAEDIIAGIVGEIETYLGRPLVVKERTEYAREGWLSATPVTAIATINGLPYDGPAERFSNGNLGYATMVRYTGGLFANDAARDFLRVEILRAAADEMTHRHDDTVSVKDLDYRDPDDDAPSGEKRTRGMPRRTLGKMDRWKRRGAFQRRGVYL